MNSSEMSAAETEALKTPMTSMPTKSAPTLFTTPRSLRPGFGQKTRAVQRTWTSQYPAWWIIRASLPTRRASA